MDKEKLKKVLRELLHDEVKNLVGDDDSDFAKMINSAVQAAMEGLQNTLSGDVTLGDRQGTVSDGLVLSALHGAHFIGGSNLVTTPKGSILDMSRKNAPWVKCSQEVEDWARAMGAYLNSGGKKVDKLLQEADDTLGGYTVPEEFRAVMLMYDAEPAVVWPRATIWPMSTDKLGMPKLAQRPDGIEDDDYDHFAGVSFTWTDEGGTKTETEPTFEFIELITHELSGYTAITNILIDDSAINIMNFLTTLFRAAWIWQTDKAFIRGDGANKPLGIVLDPNGLTVARQTAATVTFQDVNDMRTKLPSVFDAGAVWLMNKQVEGTLRNERDSNNALLLQEMYSNLADGYVSTMLGYPVVRADGKTYAMGTKGDLILANLRHYYIGDRQIFTMDSSAHYLFRNNKTAVRVSGRLDGQPAIPEAFVVLDDAA
jgi:HK97 family phage major capsid protein